MEDNETSRTAPPLLRHLRSELEPPAYDTLSIKPPSITESSSADHRGPSFSESPTQPKKKSLTAKWRDLREEDKRRRKGRYQHVTPKEADRITGLDKRKLEQSKGGFGFMGSKLMSQFT